MKLIPIPIDNIERIVTVDRIFNNVCTVSEVYSHGIPFYHVIYEDGKQSSVNINEIKYIDYKEFKK